MVIFFDFMKPREALDDAVDDLLLAGLRRLTKFTTGALDSMPNSAAWATCRWTAAVSRNALAGMQPRLRHVPPMSSFSTRATLRPADVAYSAAPYPPGPPPMTRDRIARPERPPPYVEHHHDRWSCHVAILREQP